MHTLRKTLPIWAVLAACSTDPGPRTGESSATDVAPAVTGRSSYVVTSPDTSDVAVAARARRVAEVVLGKSMTDAVVLESLARAVQELPTTRYSKVTAVHPDLSVRYDQGSDTLVVANEELEFRPPAVEGDAPANEAAARSVFDATVSQLAQAGVINPEDYDLKNVRVGWTDYVVARSDEEPEPTVLNFRFNAQRLIGGLPLRGAGMRISVHRSGRIASVKLRRASVKISAGARVPTTVSLPDCEARFRREHPDGSVHSAELAYVLPDPGAHGVAEPKCVVSFNELTRQPTGETVVARRQQARYSLTDAAADAIILPAHDVVPGDPRPASQ